MDEFILIMRQEDGLKIASPKQIELWMKETMKWQLQLMIFCNVQSIF